MHAMLLRYARSNNLPEISLEYRARSWHFLQELIFPVARRHFTGSAGTGAPPSEFRLQVFPP